jgi:hypothetical protein
MPRASPDGSCRSHEGGLTLVEVLIAVGASGIMLGAPAVAAVFSYRLKPSGYQAGTAFPAGGSSSSNVS